MMLVMLMACSGGEGSEDSGEAAESCQSVAVASYEVDTALYDGDRPTVLLDATSSVTCDGDQMVWWWEYQAGLWDIVESPDSIETEEGVTALHLGTTAFDGDALLALVPDGEDAAIWSPCDGVEVTSGSCGDDRLTWMYVTTVED